MSEQFQLGQDWVAKVTTASGDELSVMGADRPTLARVPRQPLSERLRLFRLDPVVAGSRQEPDWPLDRLMCAAADQIDALAAQLEKAEDEWIRIASQNARDATARLELVEADRRQFAQQLQQAQADLARARQSYEADVLRLTGERDEARSLSGAVGRLAIWTQHQSTCARVTEAGLCSCGLQDAWTDLEVLLHPK